MIRYPSLNVSGPLAGVYVWWRSRVGTHSSLNCACGALSSLVSYFVWIIISRWDYIKYVELVPNIQVSATRQSPTSRLVFVTSTYNYVGEGCESVYECEGRSVGEDKSGPTR